MHRLIISCRCVDFYDDRRLADDELDVLDRLIFVDDALFEVLHKVVGYLKLKAPFDINEAYELLIPKFDFYMVSEDPTGWHAFEIALKNALLVLNTAYRTTQGMQSILRNWQRLDSTSGEVCWQVGGEELLKSRIHERYKLSASSVKS